MLLERRLAESRWIWSGDGAEAPRSLAVRFCRRYDTSPQRKAYDILLANRGVAIPAAVFFQMVYGCEMGRLEGGMARLTRMMHRLKVNCGRLASGEWAVSFSRSNGAIGRM